MAALTAAMLALTAANTANNFMSQRRAATGAEAQGNYEAGVYQQDATLADTQSADAIARGREAEIRSRAGTRQAIGASRAAAAASGISVGSGSSADVQTQDARFGELDALTIVNNAKREAWGYSVQATDYRARAAMASASGRNTARSLRNASYGTLLSGTLQSMSLGSDLWGESTGGKGSMVGTRGWGG